MASWKKSSRPSAISQLFKANFLTSFSRKSLFYFTRYYTSCIILSHLYFLFERVTQGLKQRSCVRFFKNQLAFEILNFWDILLFNTSRILIGRKKNKCLLMETISWKSCMLYFRSFSREQVCQILKCKYNYFRSWSF